MNARRARGQVAMVIDLSHFVTQPGMARSSGMARKHHTPSSITALTLALLSPRLLGQTTWTVPTNAPSLRAAIQLAAPGDTVTMLPNVFDSVGNVVIDKAITLVNCRILFPDNAFGIAITGIAGGERIALRDVTATTRDDGFHQYTGNVQGLRIDLPPGAAGTIVLDHVFTQGGKKCTQRGSAGLLVTGMGNTELIARDCSFVGASGFVPYLSQSEMGPDGGIGALIETSGRLLFENCWLVGGDGGDAYWNAMNAIRARNGAPGIVVTAGTVALTDCTIREGNGGASIGTAAYPPPDPCAIAAQPAHSLLPPDCYGCTLQPGHAGMVSGCGNTNPSPPNQQLGPALDITLPASIVLAGQPILVQCASLDPAQGFSGLLAGFPLRRSLLPGILGPLWIDTIVWAGLLPPPDASGWCTTQLPPVPAVIGSPIDVRLQTVHVTNNLLITFGAPRALTVAP